MDLMEFNLLIVIPKTKLNNYKNLLNNNLHFYSIFLPIIALESPTLEIKSLLSVIKTDIEVLPLCSISIDLHFVKFF